MMFPHGYPRASRVFDVTSMISIFSSCHPFLPPSPPSSSSFLLGRYPLHLLRRRESVVVRWTISRDSSNATPCDARNREEREDIFWEEEEEEEDREKKRRRRARRKRWLAKRGVDSWREPCRSGWTTRRGPFVSSARSIVYPGVDRWPIYTCTVAPPRAREDRHKWSSTRHSEAFHAAGVLATRYASTPTPSTPSRISSGRNNLSSARWRQGVVRRDVTRPRIYERPPRRAVSGFFRFIIGQRLPEVAF